MTGKELFHRALVLLNYTNPNGEVDERQSAELYKRAAVIVNQVLADVQFIADEKPTVLADMNSPLPVSEEVAVRVMVYGVAMHVAQSEGDGDNQQIMATTYNALRNAVPRANRVRTDVLPCPMQ